MSRTSINYQKTANILMSSVRAKENARKAEIGATFEHAPLTIRRNNMKGYTLADRKRLQPDKECGDDWYDMNIITKRPCPKCGMLIVSHPDCTEACSNDDCDYKKR